jgi:hypothetical protein
MLDLEVARLRERLGRIHDQKIGVGTSPADGCAIERFSMAHRKRNPVCAITIRRLGKNQWRIAFAFVVFPIARQ